LVSVVILATGLLGLSILQGQGLKDNQDAYSRSQANFFLYDMADRLRANAEFWQDEIIDKETSVTGSHHFCNTDDPAGGSVGATPATCTQQQMAEYDVFRWESNITETLPSGAGSITIVDDPNDTSGKKILLLRIDWVRVNDALATMQTPFMTLGVRL